MNTYHCDCTTCNGRGFTTTRTLTPVMVHNYNQMVHNPPMVAVMAAKGFVAA